MSRRYSPVSIPEIWKSPFEFASEKATTEESLRVKTETVASAKDSLKRVSLNLAFASPVLFWAKTGYTVKNIMAKSQIDLCISRGNELLRG